MATREKRARAGKAALAAAQRTPGRASRWTALSSIKNHPSTIINHSGFTLIELLVAISIVAILTAILAPTLHRVRKQARAVVCQSNLRQWGVSLATYVSENEGRLPEPGITDWNDPRIKESWAWFGGWGWGWGRGWGSGWDPRKHDDAQDIRCCPMATKPANPAGLWGQGIGGTFLAWGRYQPEGEELVPGWNPYGSYGANMCVTYHWMYPNEEMRTQAWHTADARGADRIPVFADHTMSWIWPWKWNWSYKVEPPPCDAIPTGSDSGLYMSPCINRHDGGINASFLDWSVRKVGLKELWTLKWNRTFNTSGPWTKAGGVQPEDWPEWMRRFKEY